MVDLIAKFDAMFQPTLLAVTRSDPRRRISSART